MQPIALAMAVAITHASPGEIDRLCYRFMKRQAEITGQRAETVSRDYGACALISERYGVCLVLLPHRDLVGSLEYGKLLRHELAHCNGMRH